jgi:hypothetical protein
MVLSMAIWRWLPEILAAHNAIVLFFSDAFGFRGVHLQSHDFVPGGEVVSIDGDPSVRWPTWAAALGLSAGLALAARRWMLLRGLSVFMAVLLVASIAAYALDAPVMRTLGTVPATWTQAETTVWLVLPVLSALLFIGVQPLLFVGVLWTVAAEAGAILWSATRLVLLLAVAHWTGALLLPAMWFTWGLLADLLYVTSFFSISIYATLRRRPERRVQ